MCGKSKRPNGESGSVSCSVVSGEWMQKSMEGEASETVAKTDSKREKSANEPAATDPIPCLAD